MLNGKNIHLRAVEKTDAHKIMLWENNPKHWKVSDTEVPFSLSGILQLIEQQQQFRSTGQLRFVMDVKEGENRIPIGVIDLYDMNFKHGHAAVGILIGEENYEGKGFAFEALQLLIEFSRDLLGLHSLHCSVHADNVKSIHLFEKANFEKVGVRKEWFLLNGVRIDELIFQLCLKK